MQGPVNTNCRPGPVNTNRGLGSVIINWRPGAVNSNWRPGLLNTNEGPGPGPGVKERAGEREIQPPFIRSLFFVTYLSRLVVKIFGSVSFPCKSYKHEGRKRNFIFSKDFTSDVWLDLYGFFNNRLKINLNKK